MTAMLALPPNHLDEIGRIVFKVSDMDGVTLIETVGEVEAFSSYGSFSRAIATWAVDFAEPGRHQLSALIYDKDLKELSRIAPRMVSVRMQKGY